MCATSFPVFSTFNAPVPASAGQTDRFDRLRWWWETRWRVGTGDQTGRRVAEDFLLASKAETKTVF